MTHVLLNWEEWVLALVGGLVSAATYEYLRARRENEKRKLQKAHILREETWNREIGAVWVRCLEVNWGKGTFDDPPRRVFAAPLDALRSIHDRSGPHAITINFGELSLHEQTIVRDYLGGLPTLLSSVAAHVDDLLRTYGWMWTESERDKLFEVRLPLKRITEWKPEITIERHREPYIVYAAVDLSLKAFEALEALAEFAVAAQPSGRPPLPESNITST